MKKIISLFQRNYDGDQKVRDEVVPGAEWVTEGEGIATVKIDGTCCLVQGGKLFKRYDAKRGKTPPAGFVSAQEPDPVTGHHPGWVPVGNEPDSKWHREAFSEEGEPFPDGTYELIGPKVQGNPHGYEFHHLLKHGAARFDVEPPRDFAGIRAFLKGLEGYWEGIVWHHPDGRMVKIKTRDFA